MRRPHSVETSNEGEEMKDVIKKLDLAMQILVIVQQDTHDSEIADTLDALSEWREKYIQDNSREGVGA